MLRIFTLGGPDGPLVAEFSTGAGMEPYYFLGARWNQQFQALQMLRDAMATGRREMVVDALDTGNVLRNVGGMNSTSAEETVVNMFEANNSADILGATFEVVIESDMLVDELAAVAAIM
ncbi:hypothetical protein CYJ10_29985 [Cupriavidus pauculus]|uniref:Uncharacterized protein n=2 Tax=Cupriavidus pauculus TaxID=82633 RepID=A0A2N5C3N7_9BURK|nr:hypothetical protein CYJ10_29985 [Cupriavidus pauculus]